MRSLSRQRVSEISHPAAFCGGAFFVGTGTPCTVPPQGEVFPMPLDTSDQVRKGAATNAVQIAELLVK